MSRAAFRADLFAGLTVAIVAMPLSMALAIASGVGPERGLFTAVVAGATDFRALGRQPASDRWSDGCICRRRLQRGRSALAMTVSSLRH